MLGETRLLYHTSHDITSRERLCDDVLKKMANFSKRAKNLPFFGNFADFFTPLPSAVNFTESANPVFVKFDATYYLKFIKIPLFWQNLA